MEQEKTLDIRDIVKVYLEVNRWSISDMAQLIGTPRSTLTEWLAGKCDLPKKAIGNVKAFLNGDYIKDVTTVIDYILIEKEQMAADDN